MRSNLFWLSDEKWREIEPHLPEDVRGKARVVLKISHSPMIALHFLPDGADPGSPGAIDGTPTSDDELATIINKLFRRWRHIGRPRSERTRSRGTRHFKSVSLSWLRDARRMNLNLHRKRHGFAH